MKELIFAIVMNIIATLSGVTLSCFVAFVSFRGLFLPESTSIKMLAVMMLIVALAILLFTAAVAYDSFETWSEDYKCYKKWND